MTGPSSRTYWLRLPLVAAFVVVGCSKGEQGRADTAVNARSSTGTHAAITPSLKTPLALDASRMTQLAAEYHFGQPRDPDSAKKDVKTGKNKGAKLSDKPPKLKIMTATPKSPIADTMIVAKITSDGSYEGLGIGPGDNYLVRVKRGSSDAHSWSVFLVATKPFAITSLKADSEELSYGTPGEPRIVSWAFDSSGKVGGKTLDAVAYAFCIDDPTCSTQHCGYNNY